MSIQEVQKESGAGVLLAGGTILLLAGIAGIALYFTLSIGGTQGQAVDGGLAFALLIWTAVISVGVGATLLTVGGIKAHRGAHTGTQQRPA